MKIKGLTEICRKPDGLWFGTEYSYHNRKMVVKTKTGHGIKIHVFETDNSKILFTLRFNYLEHKEVIKEAIEKLKEISK